jgi:hypothetical protein
MNFNGSDVFGSSAASISTSLRDGGEGTTVPGNSWLLRVGGIQRMGNPV